METKNTPANVDNVTDLVEMPRDRLLAQQTRAEIDALVLTAKNYPREIDKAIAEAKQTIDRSPEIAAACLYALPADGKTFEGPSIRLAEIIQNSLGNIHVKTRFVSDNGDHIIAEASAIDLERNVYVSQEIPRRITNKKGARLTVFGIQNAIRAAQAIAKRNVIFSVILSGS